ncbi:ATP-binding protein [Polaromonas sp.]|uniref:sensor histidine kinase n=2 Tax=Polaromonas sp. TaxID=1869339 RepID=UPI002CA92FB0|nr:ATP-binding protein [Polaromonas sp.]HQS89781.1 ATP-binding protein [Polaromonas sp.]
MKSQRILSIRSGLARLVAACLIPAILMAAVLLHDDYQRSRARLVSDSLDAARALMLAVDGEFVGAERTLHALSTSPSIASRDFSAFHAQSARAIANSSINNITLIKPGGQQLMNTAAPFGQSLPKALSLVQFESVLATGRASISNLLMGPVLNRSVIRVAVPVRGGPEFTHYLVGVMLPSYFQKLLLERRFGADRIAVIADASGTVVARTHEIDRFIGKPVASGLLERLNSEDESAFELVSLEGIRVLTVFVRSPTSRWAVAIGTPVSSLTADLWRSLWLLGGLAVLLLCSALGIAWVMGGRIARSIRTLSASALALGDGKAVAVPALAIREADEVGKALTRASLMLAEADEALRGSEARMRGIVESATDAILTVDKDQCIVLYNPAAEKMFGWPAVEMLGKRLDTLIPARFRAAHAGHIQRFAEIGTMSRRMGDGTVLYGQRANGEEFPVEASISQLVTGEGTLFSVILRDVTARVRDHAALERSNLDLQQFAFVASHDLKTPLRSMGGFMQILERNYADKLDEKAQSLIRRTSAAVHRLEHLTEDLLSYARLNSEVRPFAPVNCADMVQEVVHLLDAALRQSGAQVTMDDLPEVMGDRTQLVQLFLNLVGNGIKYCRDREPRVHIAAQRDTQGWVFSVADNGIGIDAKHHEKIFEVFKRLHTQNEYAGTGIGLAVCRRVVERHGGKIWITSVVGQGSTFYFTIPDSPAERFAS